MAPKKAAGKKKKIVELQEPEHSPAWERVILVSLDAGQ